MSKQYGLPCPVAKSLDIIGDRWTLLIIRDLLAIGPRKYVDLSESLKGIAPNVLSDRLKLLEAHGLVEREFYEQHPPRALYKLTKKGADLRIVMQALVEWGDKYVYDGVTVVHEACGHNVKTVTYCEQCDERVAPRDVRMKYRKREAAVAFERST
ncbi:MAG: helix-turn-helix transcriptional regulator [Chloroflexi bacterium]|nr:helix-turn-helix transcriptional regulator [Chloroflexota bacterium]